MRTFGLPGGGFLRWDGRARSGGVGITVLKEGEMGNRQAAPADGIQVVAGNRFRCIKGEPMLPGATFIAGDEPAPSAPVRTVTGLTEAELGEQYGRCLEQAGFYLIKTEELGEPIEAEGISSADHGESIADLLRAAGYELKPTKKPKPEPGPSETPVGSGPSETS